MLEVKVYGIRNGIATPEEELTEADLKAISRRMDIASASILGCEIEWEDEDEGVSSEV